MGLRLGEVSGLHLVFGSELKLGFRYGYDIGHGSIVSYSQMLNFL